MYLGALPSFNGKQKIENNDEDVDHKKILKSTPPQSLNHLKRQPPSPRNIINLNSYSDSTSKSLAGPSRSKGKKRATSITSIISSLTPPPQQEISRASAQRNPQNTHHTPPPRPLAPLVSVALNLWFDLLLTSSTFAMPMSLLILLPLLPLPPVLTAHLLSRYVVFLVNNICDNLFLGYQCWPVATVDLCPDIQQECQCMSNNSPSWGPQAWFY